MPTTPLWFPGGLALSAGAVIVYGDPEVRAAAGRSGGWAAVAPAPRDRDIEREYLRFGMAGIFLARLLPGVRSFVAPFAGLVNLVPGRALIPMGLASAVWYARSPGRGALLGSEWDGIDHFIAGLNRTLG